MQAVRISIPPSIPCEIPGDKDKEVEQVPFFPEGQAQLGLERVGWSSLQLLTYPLMIVCKPAKTEGPDQPIQSEEPAKTWSACSTRPPQWLQIHSIHWSQSSSSGISWPQRLLLNRHQEEEQGYGRSRDPSAVIYPPRNELVVPTVQQEQRCKQRKSIGTLAKYA